MWGSCLNFCFCYNDIIRKEHVCDDCGGTPAKSDYVDTKEMKEILSTLPNEARMDILFYLYNDLLKKPKVVHRA